MTYGADRGITLRLDEAPCPDDNGTEKAGPEDRTVQVLLCGTRPLVLASLASLLADSQRPTTTRTMSLGAAQRYPQTVSLFDVVVLDDLSAGASSTVTSLASVFSPRAYGGNGPGFVVFTDTKDPDRIMAYVRMGVRGFVLPQGRHYELVSAIDAVVHGHAWLPPVVAAYILDGVQAWLSAGAVSPDDPLLTPEERPPPLVDLTCRESEILDLLITRGLSNADIAAKLFVSRKTVKFHVSNILRKFDVPNRMALIARMIS